MAAAAYTAEYNLAKGGSATLAQRLACAIVDYASSVVAAEAAGTTGHTQRLALATSSVQDPDSAANRMLLTVVVTLGAAGNVSPTDADIKTTVGGVWNLFAGVG